MIKGRKDLLSGRGIGEPKKTTAEMDQIGLKNPINS